jgi:hypothetical protein
MALSPVTGSSEYLLARHGVTLLRIEARSVDDLDRAFEAMAKPACKQWS